MNELIDKIDGWVWGTPLIVMIILIGVILSFRVGFLQIHKLPLALKYMFQNESEGDGEVTSFGALCTALSATIGTGNIVGVATAIGSGGPGALFWMELAAFFGMATKYAEGLLAVKYRRIDKHGRVLGGPFFYIENGLGKKWKFLGIMFSIFGLLAGILGIGTITQVNGIASAIQNFCDPENTHIAFSIGENAYSWATVITAVVIALLVAAVILGGIRRIAKVSEIIVPFMAVLYVSFAIILIICNITKIPDAIVLVAKSAFSPEAVFGGAAGITIKMAIQKGVARGIFSNEAGLGSAPIAAAAAQTKEPARQGLVCMTGTFIDTIVICTMTGLSIILTGAYVPAMDGTLEGAAVTAEAFRLGLPFPDTVSSIFVMVCLIFFAFTTILGWDYYSERCLHYLIGYKPKAFVAYKILYSIAVLIGPFLTVSAVWGIADICNGLMAFPNLIALLLLSGVVSRETKDYLTRLKNSK